MHDVQEMKAPRSCTTFVVLQPTTAGHLHVRPATINEGTLTGMFVLLPLPRSGLLCYDRKE